MATRVGLCKIPVRTLNSVTLKTPCLMQDFWPYLLSRVIANFVLKFPHLRYHGNTVVAF